MAPFDSDAQVARTAVKLILQFIHEDPDREGLKGTPDRCLRAWRELYSGYTVDVGSLFKSFTDGACNEMVCLGNITFYSTCEHHLLPFFGTATVGYIPSGKVVGVSKLARVVHAFSRRLQIQERMTAQIADAMVEHLHPAGVMVVVKGTHLCMAARGVKTENAIMTTSAVRGVFATEQKCREEFMAITGVGK